MKLHNAAKSTGVQWCVCVCATPPGLVTFSIHELQWTERSEVSGARVSALPLSCVWPKGAGITCSCWMCWNSVVASAVQMLKPAAHKDSCSLLMSCGQVVLQKSAAVYGTRSRWLANNTANRKLRVFWKVFVKYTLHRWLCDFGWRRHWR